MNVEKQTRRIEPLTLPDAKPSAIVTAPPEIRIVDPHDLYIDESYQRGLSERSVRLIRKIVEQFSWTAFKPPVTVDVGGALHVIDGQHTAIAAVTHGGVREIPVLVVEAETQATRASAFVRHNRDRIQVTPTQLHAAMVAAGDEDAMTVHQVCARAGVKILKNPPPMSRFRPGETMAVSTISSVVSRRHAAGARRILDICVKAGAAPVSATLLRAVECLLFDKEYKDELPDDRIAAVIQAMSDELESAAGRFAAERKVPLWRAFASTIFMNRRKARHG